VKKNISKMNEPPTQTDINDPTSESDNKDVGGMSIAPNKTKMTLLEEIKNIISNSTIHVSQFRIVIDDINKTTTELVENLWNTGVVFIVSGHTDLVGLNELNNKIINRSGSIGRWKVTTSADIYLEPAELFILTKELSDEQTIRLPVQQVLKCV
jgi:hypothetical protein